MELRQLDYFVAIAEEGSVTRAAARLGVAQSAASTALRRLERGLGAELFQRTTHRLELTDAGRALLPEAHRTLAAAGHARAAVQAVVGGLRGTIRMGTVEFTPGLDVTATLAAFRARHPGVAIELTHVGEGAAQLVHDVLDGRLDLALASAVGDPPAGVELTQLWAAPMRLVVPVGHRLAAFAEVDPRELAGEAFIRYHLGGPDARRAPSALVLAAAGTQAACVVRWAPAIPEMVRAGMGVSLAPVSSLGDDAPGVRAVPLAMELPPARLVLARPANRPLSAAASELAESLLDAFDPSVSDGWPAR